MRNRVPTCRRTGRLIHELLDRVVRLRLGREPDRDESLVRRDLWQTLREQANLDDPNRLDRATASGAVWVLTALLELENDRR